MFSFAYTPETVMKICRSPAGGVTLWAVVPDGTCNTPTVEGFHIVQINGKRQNTWWARVDENTMAFVPVPARTSSHLAGGGKQRP